MPVDSAGVLSLCQLIADRHRHAVNNSHSYESILSDNRTNVYLHIHRGQYRHQWYLKLKEKKTSNSVNRRPHSLKYQLYNGLVVYLLSQSHEVL